MISVTKNPFESLKTTGINNNALRIWIMTGSDEK
jgi:hypothetical protein